MDDSLDVGQCGRCGRWHRRRHAYVEEFGPGDREEWCVTGGCFETWLTGVEVMLRARHDDGDVDCRCATCREAKSMTPESSVLEWAADHGVAGPIDQLDHRNV